jgi:hypothetical protein
MYIYRKTPAAGECRIAAIAQTDSPLPKKRPKSRNAKQMSDLHSCDYKPIITPRPASFDYWQPFSR